MAADTSLKRSVKGSSDPALEFACAPCSDDGRDMTAVNYCVNCQSYFCESCLRDHNKFRAMKNHKILDHTAMKARTGAHTSSQQEDLVAQTQLSECCNDHPGNIIQMYCGQHDVVCCTVCIAVDHRSCNGVDFIPKVARGIQEGTDRHEVKSLLGTVRRELEQLKSKKINELSALNSSLEEILKEIENLKKRILDKLDELERTSVAEVRARHKDIADKLNSDVNTVEAMLKSLDTQLDRISHCNDDNEAKLFVQVKCGQKLNRSCKMYLDEVKDIDASKISYQMNTAVDEVMSENQSLINLEIGEKSKKYSASFHRQVNVRVKGDSYVCNVYDICPLNDDTFVITDFSNNKLKRLDKTYHVADILEIPVPGQPLGICKIKSNELAVTLWGSKKVQFVSVDQSMSMTKSFDVPVRCKGITYYKQQLYISCFGKGIIVYGLSGNVLREFETDQNKISDPCLLSLRTDGASLYVAAYREGLVKLNKQGQKVSVITAQNLKNAFGVCQSTSGQIFVSGCGSDNIVQIDKDGAVLQELLNWSHGIKSPHAITYFENPERLLVTVENSDEINVFKLG